MAFFVEQSILHCAIFAMAAEKEHLKCRMAIEKERTIKLSRLILCVLSAPLFRALLL